MVQQDTHHNEKVEVLFTWFRIMISFVIVSLLHKTLIEVYNAKYLLIAGIHRTFLNGTTLVILCTGHFLEILFS